LGDQVQGAPYSEYDALRKQVVEDLKRIRALNLQDKRQWYRALGEGYKLVNDLKQSEWAAEERQRRLPAAWELPSMFIHFRRAHLWDREARTRFV
jgi:hypothetical protein